MPDGSDTPDQKPPRHRNQHCGDQVIRRELTANPLVGEYLVRAADAGNMTHQRAVQISEEYALQPQATAQLGSDLSTGKISAQGVPYTPAAPGATAEPPRPPSKVKAPGCTE